MKREEIEHLLVEYAGGEISLPNRQILEKLFKRDSKLREEAEEMVTVYQSLAAIEDSQQTSAAMDEQFYAMLQMAKLDNRPAKHRVIRLNVSWLKAAAAIAACIMAFIIGRSTVSPVGIVKYKTLYVKQPAANPQQIIIQRPVVARAEKHIPVKKNNSTDDNSVLAQQLRSVYASERIGAVMKLANSPNLSDADLQVLEMALKEDPNPNVRLTVLNTLRPLSVQLKVQQVLINSLDKQDDVMVQTSIVDILVAAKSKQAIPQMIILLDNKNTDAMVQSKIKGGIESFLN